jgi:hypothetical protein
MKKFIFLVLAVLLMTGATFSQQASSAVKGRKVIQLLTRSETFGEYIKVGDFIYIVADSTLYRATTNLGPANTGTSFLATRTNYTIVNSKIINPYSGTFSDDVVMDSTLIVKGYIQTGFDGRDGQLKIYSEQSAADYTVTLNPNSAMTSAANFYLPADEPASTYPLTVTSGGVMGYNNQALTTTSNVSFGNVSASGNVTAGATKYIAVLAEVLIDSTGYRYSWTGTPNWWYFIREVVNTPSRYNNLENLGDIKIQNKAGNGLVTVASRDTTGTTAKWNFANIKNVSSEQLTSTVSDTASVVDGVTVPVGTLMYRSADSTMWVKIRLMGVKSARWNKLTPTK